MFSYGFCMESPFLSPSSVASNSSGSADHLALLFRRARYLVVLRYDADATLGPLAMVLESDAVFTSES